MADKKSPYNANFWSFLREKALSFQESSNKSQSNENLKEPKSKPMNNIVNHSKAYDIV